MRRFCRHAAALALPVLACTGRGHALQRVTLQNGFSYDCTRQEALDPSHVRLYLTAAQPGAAPNYIDLPLAAVAGVETLPDPAEESKSPHAAAPKSLGNLPSLLARAGSAHDIDAELLASIVHAESGGRADAISRVGAVGLMQLMPATALSLGVLEPRLPEGNINGGAAYLDLLLTRYGNNLALALAAYNAGPGAVDRYHGIPPFAETRAYVARVMTEFKRRKLELRRNGSANGNASAQGGTPASPGEPAAR